VRWRFAVTLLVVASCAVPVAGDDLSIQVDPRADFSTFRTFALRNGKINSPRPELDNPLFVKKLGTTIRTALVAKGLKETTTSPDLLVDYTLTGEDISIGMPTPARGVGPRPVRFTEGTLVIDITKAGDTNPVWRGIYRDDESTGSKLMQKLPEDAKKLIARYPRRTK
jgi:hypothetical protein